MTYGFYTYLCKSRHRKNNGNTESKCCNPFHTLADNYSNFRILNHIGKRVLQVINFSFAQNTKEYAHNHKYLQKVIKVNPFHELIFSKTGINQFLFLAIEVKNLAQVGKQLHQNHTQSKTCLGICIKQELTSGFLECANGRKE